MKTLTFIFTYATLFIYNLQHHLVYSYSACDPTDVFFLVDTATIRAGGIQEGSTSKLTQSAQDLIRLIDSVISRGSSEETGFSVIIWGDNIPELKYGKNADNDNSILCEIDETSTVYDRRCQLREVNKILRDAFEKIITSQSGASVSFNEAFNNAKQEAKSDGREHVNRQQHGNSVGLNEDEDIFVVFDFDNVLAQSGEMKKLYDEFKENDEQSIHFVVDKPIKVKKDNIRKIKLNPSQAALKSHFFVFQSLVDDIGDVTPHSMWDQLLDLTCPAMIITDDDSGCQISLGNHVQYIEADTIERCELEYIELEGDLDERKSFLYVTDDLECGSTATFEVDDYLFVDIDTVVKIPVDCENVGVVQIAEIITVETNDKFNKLKLRIKDPADISYITGGSCEGTVDNQVIKGDINSDGTVDTRRRTLSTNPRITLTFESSDTWTKEATYKQTKWRNGAQWSLESYGKIEASYRAAFTIYVGLYLRVDGGIDWCCTEICACIWSCCFDACVPCGFYVEFQVELQAGYLLEFDFNLKFEAWAKLNAPRLLYYQRESIAYIAGVPVKYRPWMEVDLTMYTIPVYAEAWIDCEYGHDVAIGYEYKSRGGGRGAYVNGPTPRANTCNKGWNIRTGDAGFPRRLGVDTTIDGIIGLDFYKCVSGQFIAEFTVPLHLTFTPDTCDTWGPCDRNYKPAVFTLEVNLQPMYRIVYSASAAADVAKALAASVLSVFGISIGDMHSTTSNLIGHVDKSRANRIGGPINVWRMTPQCYDISGYAFVGVLIDKYCGQQADCNPYPSYGKWIQDGNCNPPACYELPDKHDHCNFWASIGECTKNPAYMLQSCQMSCDTCNNGCNEKADQHWFCGGWAWSGECYNNPLYMLDMCQTSCNVCRDDTVPIIQLPPWAALSIIAFVVILTCYNCFYYFRVYSKKNHVYKVVNFETDTE